MLLGIFIGVVIGSLATTIMLSMCQSSKIRDLLKYYDYTVNLYATGEVSEITKDDLKRLKLFRLSKLQVI
jgi:hypothetical protein